MSIELDYHATVGADYLSVARDLRDIADSVAGRAIVPGYTVLKVGTLHVWERGDTVTVARTDAQVAISALRGLAETTIETEHAAAARIEAAL